MLQVWLRTFCDPFDSVAKMSCQEWTGLKESRKMRTLPQWTNGSRLPIDDARLRTSSRRSQGGTSRKTHDFGMVIAVNEDVLKTQVVQI